MIRFPKKIRKLLIKNVVITHARFIRIVNADRWKYLINKTIAHNRKKYPIKKRISDVKPPTEWAHIFSSKAYFLNAYLGKKNAVNKFCCYLKVSEMGRAIASIEHQAFSQAVQGKNISGTAHTARRTTAGGVPNV